jgi:hypothetical protein
MANTASGLARAAVGEVASELAAAMATSEPVPRDAASVETKEVQGGPAPAPRPRPAAKTRKYERFDQ